MVASRCSPLAALSAPRPDRETLVPLLRWLILGAAIGLCLIILVRAEAVGAAAPPGCIPINQTSCLSNGIIYTNGVATMNIGQPNSVVVPGYVVPAYYGGGYGNYVVGNYLPFYGRNYGGYFNNYYNNFYTENYGYLGTNCDPKAWWCLNYEYTGDVFGTLFAPPGVTNPSTPAATGAPSPGVIYRPAEVAQPATTTAPVVGPTVQQVQPAQAAAPQMATALNAPAQAPVDTAGGSGVHILSAQPATAPAATSGADDHHG